LQICKRVLSVRSYTHNCMVYAEMGRFPLELQTKIKIICLWNKLVSSEYKLSANIYQILLTLHSSGSNKFKWIDYVKSIIDDTCFSNIWISQPNIIIFLTTVKERLQDQFIQKWFSDIDNASGGEFYSHLQTIYSNHTYWDSNVDLKLLYVN
jgi:hypothetical protein